MPKIDAAPFSSLVRYSLALIGPVGSAGAQFVLTLVLLRVSDQAAFGRFSFLLIASQLSWGVCSALFCAPLPLLIASGEPQGRERFRRCLLAASLIGACLAFGVFVLLGLGVGEPLPAATLLDRKSVV